MPSCFVKEGACDKEILIRITKNSKVKFKISLETACPYLNNLGKHLKEVNVGEILSQPLLETEVYKQASKFICRNSCSVPAAILKLIEVATDTFPPKPVVIEFTEEV